MSTPASTVSRWRSTTMSTGRSRSRQQFFLHKVAVTALPAASWAEVAGYSMGLPLRL